MVGHSWQQGPFRPTSHLQLTPEPCSACRTGAQRWQGWGAARPSTRGEPHPPQAGLPPPGSWPLMNAARGTSSVASQQCHGPVSRSPCPWEHVLGRLSWTPLPSPGTGLKVAQKVNEGSPTACPCLLGPWASVSLCPVALLSIHPLPPGPPAGLPVSPGRGGLQGAWALRLIASV